MVSGLTEAMIHARVVETIELAAKSRGPRYYSVGCVIIDSENSIRATGFTGEFEYQNGSMTSPHAEEVALSKLQKTQGLILISSMEPCSERKSGKLSCCSRIIAAGITTVVFGAYEPFDPGLKIICKGAELLRQAGIEVVTVPSLAERCLAVAVGTRPQS